MGIGKYVEKGKALISNAQKLSNSFNSLKSSVNFSKTNNLTNMLNSMKNKNWTKADDFYVEIKPISEDFKKIIGWDDSITDACSFCLESITLPDRTTDSIQSYYANDWRYVVSRESTSDVTIAFKDFDGGSFYNMWFDIFNKTKINYPEHTFFTIIIRVRKGKTSSGFTGNSVNGVFNQDGYRVLTIIKRAMISRVTFGNLDYKTPGILNFSVGFKVGLTPAYTHQEDNFIG